MEVARTLGYQGWMSGCSSGSEGDMDPGRSLQPQQPFQRLQCIFHKDLCKIAIPVTPCTCAIRAGFWGAQPLCKELSSNWPSSAACTSWKFVAAGSPQQ